MGDCCSSERQKHAGEHKPNIKTFTGYSITDQKSPLFKNAVIHQRCMTCHRRRTGKRYRRDNKNKHKRKKRYKFVD